MLQGSLNWLYTCIYNLSNKVTSIYEWIIVWKNDDKPEIGLEIICHDVGIEKTETICCNGNESWSSCFAIYSVVQCFTSSIGFDTESSGRYSNLSLRSYPSMSSEE